jgi:hypothetical protein
MRRHVLAAIVVGCVSCCGCMSWAQDATDGFGEARVWFPTVAGVTYHMAEIGDSRAANMLHEYADRLQAALSGMPKVRQTQMMKIMESRKAAEGLK